MALAFADPHLFSARAQVSVVGPQYEDDQNGLPMPGFVRVDLFLARPLVSGLLLFAAAENLFNASSLVGRSGVDTVGQPRTLRVGLRYAQNLE